MGVEAYRNKETSKQVSKKMEDLNEILNNSWDGIAILTEDGTFIFTNKAFSPILNYKKDEFTRLSFINLVIEDYREKIRFAFEKAKQVGNVRNVKVVCRRKDKELVYLECSLALMQNKKYFVLNARDYTEEVAKDNVIDKYILSYRLDKEFKILEISSALSELLKYDKKKLIGKFYSKIIDPKVNLEKFQSIIDTTHKENHWEGTLKYYSIDNEEFILDTKIETVHNKYGDIIGYFIICINVTDKFKLKELNKKLQMQLDNSKNSIKEQRKQLDIITQATLNWMKPLDNIYKRVEIIKQKDFDKDSVKNVLESIEKEALLLKKNMKKFKDLYGKDELEDINLKDLLEQILNIIEKSNKDNKLTLNKNLVDVKIKTFKTKLTEVIFSIITNSLEAFKRNNISKPVLDVTISKGEKVAKIIIMDNGGGISSNIIDKVFEPYFTTKNQAGKGVGLYLAKMVVEQELKGKISISSNENITTATILLPIL